MVERFGGVSLRGEVAPVGKNEADRIRQFSYKAYAVNSGTDGKKGRTRQSAPAKCRIHRWIRSGLEGRGALHQKGRK